MEKIKNPVKGTIKDITNCSDEVFAQKTLGDGFLVIPSDSTIVAPCDGVVLSIFPTKHAIGFKTNDNTEILIHIGIDTVELEGNGFNQLVENNTHVYAGQPLIQIDRDLIKNSGYSDEVIVIFTNKKEIVKLNLNTSISEYIDVAILR